ncbi:MAG: hypothetical protein UU48_C0006G0040 [Candidatus Uhrbacteria bacterium GW2011_GWF2_41_16]|jgi:hypothetical protein|uniref:Uncharacterized protein n=2 Tax=Candidatus Uhriibacteriota TaxID=1752732 RepID=A0A0G0XMI0_9BACT|nr:MAG: hypothetical protein UU35_C0007G0093 [Candidatus Uhrbacteria bacterium GW2011_GWC2_41_11]KKR98000.1 MAG: hypothetical protein UU48_C0006G0040 [Candidatus Uhrbacteria bacterium GW2011_GWF2_41_16]
MGMRKKGRTQWKLDRKVEEAKRRKQKAIRFVKAKASV